METRSWEEGKTMDLTAGVRVGVVAGGGLTLGQAVAVLAQGRAKATAEQDGQCRTHPHR